MLEQLAGALASAHRRDIVHGAITGTNVLLDADGNAYLADFPIGVDRPGSTVAGDVADLIALFPGLVSTASEDAGSLITNLHQAGGAPLATTSAADERNPYKGLRPFTEADAVDFHGRETLTRQLHERLDGTEPWARFLAVVGPSGSGKSSVVRAGLLPALRSDAASSDEVFVADMFPGAHPIDELAAALLRVAVRAMTRLEDLLHGGFQGACGGRSRTPGRRRARPGHRSARGAVHPHEGRARASTVPRAAPGRRGGTRRAGSGWWSRSAPTSSTGRSATRASANCWPLRPRPCHRCPPTSSSARSGHPRSAQGVSVEPGVVAEIVADVAREPGALPAVQFAVTELYERRAGAWLTAASYAEWRVLRSAR